MIDEYEGDEIPWSQLPGLEWVDPNADVDGVL